jgi:hypothetical protein
MYIGGTDEKALHHLFTEVIGIGRGFGGSRHLHRGGPWTAPSPSPTMAAAFRSTRTRNFPRGPPLVPNSGNDRVTKVPVAGGTRTTGLNKPTGAAVDSGGNRSTPARRGTTLEGLMGREPVRGTVSRSPPLRLRLPHEGVERGLQQSSEHQAVPIADRPRRRGSWMTIIPSAPGSLRDVIRRLR